jgi:hypothetical protein
MRFTALLILIFFGAFTGTALAADAVSATDPSLGEAAKAIFDAVMHGNWWAVAAYGVILAMIGARKFMPEGWKAGTKGDVIGTAAAFVLAFAGSIATVMIAPGAAMTTAVLLTALKIGVAAIGGYTIIHKVLGWIAEAGFMPAWATSALKLIAAMIGSNAIKKAEAAGEAAVRAKPPTGMTGDAEIKEID